MKVPEEEWLDDVLMTLVTTRCCILQTLAHPIDSICTKRFETLKKRSPKNLAARFVAAYGALHRVGGHWPRPAGADAGPAAHGGGGKSISIAQALAQSLPGDDARWVLDAFVWIGCVRAAS